jgi:hypothetical protein
MVLRAIASTAEGPAILAMLDVVMPPVLDPDDPPCVPATESRVARIAEAGYDVFVTVDGCVPVRASARAGSLRCSAADDGIPRPSSCEVAPALPMSGPGHARLASA